jgi:hypothetical protein
VVLLSKRSAITATRRWKKIIVFEKTDYFKKFMPNGIIEIALANKKHFKIKPDYTGVSVTPDETLGSVYKLADQMAGLNFNEVFCLPPDEGPPETFRLTDLAYIVLYSCRDKYFPFLLPCLGILNKAETDMKGFYDFITDSSPQYEGLTSEQRKLNGICHAMWQEVKNENGSLIFADIEQTSNALTLFNLWNKALSLLHQQSYIYQYNFYHKFQVKDKPQKGRLQRIHFSRQKPTLCFRLTDKTTFCQLELSVSIQGKTFKHFDTVSNFFICIDKKLYLLSSLRDVAIVEWMRRCDNRITVFKEHFAEFRNEYLEPICSHYPFEMTYAKR